MTTNGYSEIARTCACFHLRRASRAISSLYDHALSPTGLRSTQFVALLTLAMEKDLKISSLASVLGMDRTTATRLLSPLKKRGLVKLAAGKDKRNRHITLTPEGSRMLEGAIPFWQQAQSKVTEKYGSSGWEVMLTELNKASQIS